MKKVLFLCISVLMMVGSAWAQNSNAVRDDRDRLIRSLPKTELNFNSIAAKKEKAANPNMLAACTDIYVDAVNGNDGNTGETPATAKQSIQAGIDAVCAGGTVHVYPGSYNETAAGRFVLGVNGPYQFGLFIDKDDITIQGVDGSGTPITAYAGVLAEVATNATNNFGYSGIFVEGDGVTIQGLRVLSNSPSDNKTFEIIGDAFTLKYCDITTGYSVYFDDWRYDDNTTPGDDTDDVSHVKSYTVEANLFQNGGSIDLASGAGFSGPTSGRMIKNNKFEEDTFGQNWPFISFNGSGTTVPWFVYSVGGAEITGNDFSNTYSTVSLTAAHIRARGLYDNSQFDWESYWNDNTFNKAVITLIGAYPPFDVRTYAYSTSYTFPNVRRIGLTIQGEIDNAAASDNVLVAVGTYPESNIHIDVAVSIIGAGTASTFVDGGGSGNIFYVDVDGVTIKDLTIQNGAQGARFEKAGGTIDNTEFNNVQFKNNSSRGIEIHNATTVTDLRIVDCHFENNNTGIRMASSALADGITITGSTFTGHSLGFYQANDGSTGHLRNLHIDDCTFTNNSFAAVYAEEIRDSIVENSFFTGNGRGFYIFKEYTSAGVGVENVTVRGNEFTDHTAATILIWVRNSALAGTLNIENNKINESVGTSTANWGMIDVRLDPAYTHAAITIQQNTVNFSGTFAGGAGATASYAVKLRGGLSDITIDENSFNGGDVADGGGVPPLSGIYFQVSDATFGTIPASSVVNITGNTIRNFVNGIVVYDPTPATYGGLLAGTTVNVTECNQIFSNSSHGIRNDGTSETINAPGNWWGNSSGPSGAGSGSGDVASTNVVFTPWGTDAACGASALHNFVYLANEQVTIARSKHSASKGDIHSNGGIYFQRGDPNTYYGNLTAGGAIKIDKEIKIDGDATAGGKITLSGNAKILGTKTQYAAVASVPLPSLSYNAGGPNVTVAKKKTVSIAPGSYNNVIVNDGGTLKFVAGTYNLNILETKDDENTLYFDVTNGPVILNIVTNLKLSEEVTVKIVPDGEDGSEKVTFNTMQSTQVLIGKESYVLGNIIAPNAEVYLAKNVSFRGAITAKRITVDRDVYSLHHSSPGTLPFQKGSADDGEELLSEQSIVTDYVLSQNYPNPFNPSTRITFALPEAGHVQLHIYNSFGQLVRTLANRELAQGWHELTWDGRNQNGQTVATGVYLYSIIVQDQAGAATYSETRRMSFVK